MSQKISLKYLYELTSNSANLRADYASLFVFCCMLELPEWIAHYYNKFRKSKSAFLTNLSRWKNPKIRYVPK